MDLTNALLVYAKAIVCNLYTTAIVALLHCLFYVHLQIFSFLCSILVLWSLDFTAMPRIVCLELFQMYSTLKKLLRYNATLNTWLVMETEHKEKVNRNKYLNTLHRNLNNFCTNITWVYRQGSRNFNQNWWWEKDVEWYQANHLWYLRAVNTFFALHWKLNVALMNTHKTWLNGKFTGISQQRETNLCGREVSWKQKVRHTLTNLTATINS